MVGLNINLPFETGANPFIDRDKSLNHNYFFVRKVMFVKYAQAFVFLPGGYGALVELFRVTTFVKQRWSSKAASGYLEKCRPCSNWVNQVAAGLQLLISGYRVFNLPIALCL
ncbi:MAG TPA: LOG family protein [Chitinophagales bacterium]|nr:LOG family protein [Chitinophagales bacterium]HRK27741.1 LOG family protein [Chitinophagales bacterium]